MSQFADRVLVRCPRCDGCALVLACLGAPESMRDADGTLRYRRRMRCPDCGLFKDAYPAGAPFGVPIDPYFGSPLWLRARCCGHTLWAYDLDHLTMLQAYVSAGLRERGPDPDSMLSRLPAWMKAGKHRDDVMRTIDRLRRSMPAGVLIQDQRIPVLGADDHLARFRDTGRERQSS
ncbi:hypothetical protein ACIBF1_03250 [Spirillospora sp. NPDC050679]